MRQLLALIAYILGLGAAFAGRVGERASSAMPKAKGRRREEMDGRMGHLLGGSSMTGLLEAAGMRYEVRVKADRALRARTD